MILKTLNAKIFSSYLSFFFLFCLSISYVHHLYCSQVELSEDPLVTLVKSVTQAKLGQIYERMNILIKHFKDMEQTDKIRLLQTFASRHSSVKQRRFG